MMARELVHVLNSTAVGGAEMMVLHLLAGVDRRAWHPHLVTLRGHGPLSDRFAAIGVTVHDLALPEGARLAATTRSLRRTLRAIRPDVIHSHNVAPLVATAAATIGWQSVRHVHTKHGRARAARLAGQLAVRWAIRRPAAIAVVSSDAAQRAVRSEGYPASRIHVIPNGIPLGPAPARTPIPYRLLLVARLMPIKTVELLLQAMPLLARDMADVTLDIVGDGQERLPLEARVVTLGIADRVTFHGEHADIAPFLRQAACFVLPSRSEGISLTILEAMAAGLPVVATSVGGNPEVIVDGVTGRLVPHGDPAQLAAALHQVLASADQGHAMGVAGRERALQHFGVDTMVARYEALYRGE